LELSFKMGPLISVRALTRVILSQTQPSIKLYFLPLQIHPLKSPWHYAAPRRFVKQTWKACGPFLTVGWPQDTTALEDGCITDDQFLNLCNSIYKTRGKTLLYHIDRFREGVLASVFDTLDRVQHMCLREHPKLVENWYVKMDALVGRALEHLGEADRSQTQVLVVSDHGFSDYRYHVHLNRWLAERGYLVSRENGGLASLQGADWAQSQAYAIGLNSVYLNQKGREGQGCVEVEERPALLEGLKDQLLAWRGPDGRPVVQQALRQDEAFEGPLASYGPDLVVGYAPGYRASAETGLGEWKASAIEANTDHWASDHCIAPAAVPGVLFADKGLSEFPRPSYRDFPLLAIGALPEQRDAPPPTALSNEDEEAVQKRLRSLGYL
jgi:hypothetical protein